MSDSSTNPPTKVCTRCSVEKPATTEFFYKDKSCKNGLKAYCIECKKAYSSSPRQLEKQRERNCRLLEESPEANRENCRRWRETNPEKKKLSGQKWYADHPDKERERRHRRRALVANAEGTHTAADIRLQVQSQTNKKGRLLCWWCEKPINDDYHVDHRIPLVKGGTNNPDNIVITHPECNLSKQDKMPHEFNGRLL